MRSTSDAASPGIDEPGADDGSPRHPEAPDLALAERLLGTTFKHALKSDFHRRRLAGFDHAVSTASWHLLPEMTREQLESCMGDIVLDAGTRREYVHTGGSSGRPLVFPKTLAEESFIREFFSQVETGRDRELVRGIRFTTPYHGHETPVPVNAWFHKISPFDYGGFAFARRLLATPWDAPGVAPDCTVVAGAERFVRAFTLDCEAAGVDGVSSPVAFLLPNGQYLSAAWRRRYTEYWGAVIIDRFALSEAFGGATEDPETGWYLFDPCCFPEVVALDTRRPIFEGIGELVLTPLYPFQQGLPLIRYATGDLVAVNGRHPRSAGHPAIRPLGRLYHALRADDAGMPLVPAAVGAEVIDEMPDVSRAPLYRDARHLVARQGLGHAIYHMGRATEADGCVIRLHIQLEPGSHADAARAAAVGERFRVHYGRIVGVDLPDHVGIDVRFARRRARTSFLTLRNEQSMGSKHEAIVDGSLTERMRIREVVENWVLWRDAGDWERFRTVWHPQGRMMATWFQGPAERFIEVSRAGFEKGVRILHFLGGSTIEVAETRAIAQTKMTISQRAEVDGVRCDVLCTGRFYDFFEQHEGRWVIVLRQPIYEKDRLDPLDPSAVLKLDPKLLGQFPEGYRHLAYAQTRNGYTVKRDMPQLTGPEVERLYADGAAWLAGMPLTR